MRERSCGGSTGRGWGTSLKFHASMFGEIELDALATSRERPRTYKRCVHACTIHTHTHDAYANGCHECPLIYVTIASPECLLALEQLLSGRVDAGVFLRVHLTFAFSCIRNVCQTLARTAHATQTTHTGRHDVEYVGCFVMIVIVIALASMLPESWALRSECRDASE